MDLPQVLAALQAEARENTATIYRRHGAKGRVLGVSSSAIGKLVKRLGVDQSLAEELWRTGIHEARVVATKIADAAAISTAELERWVTESRDYITIDNVSGLAARTRGAQALCRRWIGDPGEWKSAAGWNILGWLVLEGRLDAAAAKPLLGRIEKGIHRAPNRTRYAMNGALISIGGSLPGLTEAAVAAAQRIGAVEVDHGQTGCKTPSAAGYIRKMAGHRAKRSRVTGTRMAAGRSQRKRAPGPTG